MVNKNCKRLNHKWGGELVVMANKNCERLNNKWGGELVAWTGVLHQDEISDIN